MNNRFLFRGKHVFDGKWIQGYYAEEYGTHGILTNPNDGVKRILWNVIDPSTVGQCTGIHDKNGILIFEGDIIGNFKPHGTFNPTVQFHDGAFWLADFHLSSCAEKAEVIGNIHDNPELLEENND